MDLKLLNSFIAVAEEGQLSRAAARLHLSQPPLSRHIQALETELGVQLFVRTGSGMELTQAGAVLLEDARNIGLFVKTAVDRTRNAGAGRFGQISIGVYGSSIYGTTAAVLSQFKRENPGVSISLHYAQTPAQVQALRRGQVEIVFERMVPQDDDIRVRRIASERLYVALNDGHPLASQRSLSLPSLKKELFLIGSEPTAAAQVVEACKQAGFTPRVSLPSSSVVTAALLAATGMGISLVPESMTHVRFPGIQYIPLDDCPSTMDLYCFYRHQQPSPILGILLDQIARGAPVPGTAPEPPRPPGR